MSEDNALPERVPPIIRAILGFTRLSNGELSFRLGCIRKGMKDNPDYSNPPIEIAKFEAAVDRFNHACLLAEDGSRTAILERDAQRRDVILMAQEIGHYVEHNCNGEMDKFLSSGYQPRSTTRTPAGFLDIPVITKIRHGKSGELLVSVTPVKGTYSYELRYAPLDQDDRPGEWTVRPMSSARAAVSIEGLKPGAIYAFQVHALGKLGYTDWCDAARMMCT